MTKSIVGVSCKPHKLILNFAMVLGVNTQHGRPGNRAELSFMLTFAG